MVLVGDARRASDHCQVLYALRKTLCPVIGLHPTHQPVAGQFQAINAEGFLHQAALDAYVVGHSKARPVRDSCRCHRIAGRRGHAITELVRNNDEIALGVERAAWADLSLDIHVPVAEGLHYQDNVRLICIERAVRLVG